MLFTAPTAPGGYACRVQGRLARWRFRGELGGAWHAKGLDVRALPLRERVLAARGVLEPAERASFLAPKLTHLHDPSLIPDLDRAADRLLAELNAPTGRPIVIYGDYDVDGVTGTAILFHTLRAIAPDADIRTYVPHRLEEGYGLNCDAIAELADAGAAVIVSVDCGITAVEPARLARSRGVDLIITDHHHPPAALDDLPEAFAVVHPRRPDSNYPFPHLSGAGVAYKLAWRLATRAAGSERVSPAMRELLVDLLAFAALGSIADIVPLVGENRVIARHGLVRVKHSRFIGLRALVEASGLAGEDIDAMHVGFRLGPRLNAAGRMGHARDANELFTVADDRRAAEIAANLSRQNQERRDVERRIFDAADEMAQRIGMTSADRRAIVLAHEDWHPGVVGIVCSRLVEKHCRPVILMNRRDGMCHGSGRSIEGFDLHAALNRCAAHLDRFGGHTMAAGLHLREPKLGVFTDAFLEVAGELIEPDRMCRWLTLDAEADLDELTPAAVAELSALEPCGAGNPDAQVLIRGAIVADRPMSMGAEARHVAVQLRSPRGIRVRAVGWGMGEHRDALVAGVPIDVVVRPRISTWNGSTRVEPEIRDFRVSGCTDR